MTDNTSSKQFIRYRDPIIAALRAGLTPKVGIAHIQVGRVKELESLSNNMRTIAAGGSTFRFINGNYGAGKTFLLNLARTLAHNEKLVTVYADLSPDRRLYSTSGHARKLYAELLNNISTANVSGSYVMHTLVESFINEARKEAEASQQKVEAIIKTRLEHFMQLRCGHDFARVIDQYWQGHRSGDDNLRNAAIRWLRGEYETKTEAKKALGVEQIVSDDTIFDMLKLLGLFVCQAGYCGLLVQLDELGNLLQLQQSTRDKNYEKILYIVNQALQGELEHLGFIFCGTPDLLHDSEKGLYSNHALRSRLENNQFAKKFNVKDYSTTVLELDSLTPYYILELLNKLNHIWANGEKEKYLLDSQAIKTFVERYQAQLGDDYYLNPRTIIKGFLDFLAILSQKQGLNWQDALNSIQIVPNV